MDCVKDFSSFLPHVIFLNLIAWGNRMWSCLDTVSILFIHGIAMLAMERKSVLPMHMAILCEKEEVHTHQKYT